VLATRWTLRAGESLRLWTALALQSDHPEGVESRRAGLLTLGSEYIF
jgi:hypothetical protein